LQITSAVININGKEYEGKNHAEAILKAQADGQDISQVDRQAEGLFKLSDGTIINREQAKEQFGQDRSELIIPQDEASNQANVEYKIIQDEQKNPITPVEPINAGQELNNGTGIQQADGNGGEIQQGDGIGQISGQENPTEKVEEGIGGTESIKNRSRKDLFPDESEFSDVIGGSGKNSKISSYKEVNGIGISEYKNPDSGVVDVIMTGTSDNDYVGYVRIYENGKPTERWTSKMENKSGNKANFKTMISEVKNLLPANHEYTESTNISLEYQGIYLS